MALMARMWLRCPCSSCLPSLSRTPREVPSSAASTSWTPRALPESTPCIVCVGETLAEREGGQMEKVLETQVGGSLAGLTKEQMAETVIAYEPVWAIGT